ncbi:hypothetical protein Mal4_03100 [Maioricimonas rarisocia]|uniref:Uncharacterized protein n=1 Tax=Maioricimonas rarisocia TaxID=2528026 RepID=A0A517Z0M7_9PLAN|nr:hypothetical protein [Maioricimonas rarisocia]QDU36027.1 hypothetical protein Mal4_03100 [Maioricimonas rarisocia]
MKVLVVRRTIATWKARYRTCPLHNSVFHGRECNGDLTKSTGIDESGDVTFSMSGTCHVVRSGRFCPDVFCPGIWMIVADSIRERLDQLGRITFSRVIFDKLVDVELPALGDASWFERTTYPTEPEPDLEWIDLPDVPSFHEAIGDYFVVGGPVVERIRNQLSDIQEVTCDFGSFPRKPKESTVMSKQLLEEFPITWNGCYFFREDAFEVIAPHLDLDYFSVACVTI